jgi:hypothetical protein
MAVFVAPKTWATNDVLLSDDLNDLTAEIAASVNAIVDAQIAVGANIQGSKIASAPNGISAGKINNLAVTQSKIAVGATVAQQFTDSVDPPTFNGSSGVVVLVSRASVVITRNGTVLVFASIWGAVRPTTVDRTMTFVLERINGGTTTLATVTMEATPFDSDTGLHPLNMTIPYVDSAPGAGTYTYRLTGDIDGGASELVILSRATLDILELA